MSFLIHWEYVFGAGAANPTNGKYQFARDQWWSIPGCPDGAHSKSVFLVTSRARSIGLEYSPPLFRISSLAAVYRYSTPSSGHDRAVILSPRHPAKNAECYQGSRPLRPVGNVLYAGLAAPYDRGHGRLMIWPPEHRYRWAGGGSTG